jgi:hypothetical protein
MDTSDRRKLTADVSADLAEIFQAPRADAAPPSPRVQTYVAAPAQTGSGRRARYGGLAAAALAGLAIGAVLMEPRDAPPAPTIPVSVMAAPLASGGGLTAPIATPAVASPVPAPPNPIEASPRPKVQKAVEVRRPPRPKAAKRAETRRAEASGCGQLDGDERARCAYPDVLAADRRLRRAYEDAADAGVGSAELAGYRNRWSRMSRRAHLDPGDVIDGYGMMTGDLRRLARDAEAARS